MLPHTLTLTLPAWFDTTGIPALHTAEERMRAAVALARRNVEEETGGPFGALVVDHTTGVVLAAGVNIVIPSHDPLAHAELVALALACRARATHTLAGEGTIELVTTVEPCAMCLGAIPWSGIARLLIGARGDDAQAIGFDEGEKPARWQEALAARGITVVRDILRAEAADVLRSYAARGGMIYNGRSIQR